ncbi:D-serine ammonia-lyase [Bacillus sp. V33-4]|uniref:D-serine ammonia-lyase n=1 Tax=Bacillus sp. V33-4 TaxID=2054169 RepID=UPI000C773B6C|nr:D-serine ammonia-lyase [Bacillus sp. V33-4]PLR81686.1 D-serine ammonia-lyase [Bacillus sp. V33-4]
MRAGLIGGKTIEEWTNRVPILKKLIDEREAFWLNPDYGENWNVSVTEKELMEASSRLKRFAPYIAKVFPETRVTAGVIESPLLMISRMKRLLEDRFQQKISGEVWLKCDNELPISGSIKARGGIYEVLKHAESLALQNGMLRMEDDYTVINSDKFKKFFSNYSISVGSTGNLGLSIGIIAAKLGFKVTVHMSANAKAWKKDLLKKLGVGVIEYNSDYSQAVAEGRKQAEQDPFCHFIDDENSRDLFLGYAVAALRLQTQLMALGKMIGKDQPLFVYLPCGVGGGPGGITFGLKSLYKENVHCFFAEPVQSPCMLAAMATGLHENVSVQQFGLDNETAADGLAVGRASGFVSRNMKSLLSGIFTINDETLLQLMKDFWQAEKIFIEASAAAGALGPISLFRTGLGLQYIEEHQLHENMKNAVHVIWATGGGMVPERIKAEYLSG